MDKLYAVLKLKNGELIKTEINNKLHWLLPITASTISFLLLLILLV